MVAPKIGEFHPETKKERRFLIGSWYVTKYRRRVREAGSFEPVAKQLRKQGVPLEVALKVLGVRPFK